MLVPRRQYYGTYSENGPKKSQNDFFTPQKGQISDVNMAKSVDFRVHCRPTSSIFGLWVLKKNKIVPHKSQTHFKKKEKKYSTYFKKQTENDFFKPQNCQMSDVNLAKSVDFWVHFRPTSPIFALLVPKILQKSFPLIS